MKEWDLFLKVRLHERQRFGLAGFSNMPTRQVEAPQALNEQRLLPVNLQRQIFSCFQTWAVVLPQPDTHSLVLWGLSHPRFKDLPGLFNCTLCRCKQGDKGTFASHSSTDGGVKMSACWSGDQELRGAPSAETLSPRSFVWAVFLCCLANANVSCSSQVFRLPAFPVVLGVISGCNDTWAPHPRDSEVTEVWNQWEAGGGATFHWPHLMCGRHRRMFHAGAALLTRYRITPGPAWTLLVNVGREQEKAVWWENWGTQICKMQTKANDFRSFYSVWFKMLKKKSCFSRGDRSINVDWILQLSASIKASVKASGPDPALALPKAS